MADPRYTRERADWVVAHAARRPEWQRRGQRLTTRVRRKTRYEVGAGDAGAADVAVPHRFHRRRWGDDGTSVRRTVWAATYEVGAALLAGPGIALSWAIYGAWYRKVPAWGPLRWRPLGIATVVVTVLVVLIVTGATIFGGGLGFWGWYWLAQLTLGVGRSAWLAYAYGWEAVPDRAATAAPAPIRVRLGDEPPLPETEPTEPVQVRVTVHNDDEES
ncbi:hypothetical protein [Gordonia sp. 852002-51296_SCH5728562-b]|uniref:hypothetical protein n=1 Tax=Gordonia sp. 852002-51296_SCH5728562-b TaxID=1834101 RepID=UPI0007EBF3D0|nr:hypothetical protein [Gordonia sp. 852002-51296_SCH5728562-b]OBA40780.1 hypothetical protein A5766_01950 [Gordonia sp. 852002-51296_SCH5728562-b]